MVSGYIPTSWPNKWNEQLQGIEADIRIGRRHLHSMGNQIRTDDFPETFLESVERARRQSLTTWKAKWAHMPDELKQDPREFRLSGTFIDQLAFVSMTFANNSTTRSRLLFRLHQCFVKWIKHFRGLHVRKRTRTEMNNGYFSASPYSKDGNLLNLNNIYTADTHSLLSRFAKSWNRFVGMMMPSRSCNTIISGNEISPEGVDQSKQTIEPQILRSLFAQSNNAITGTNTTDANSTNTHPINNNSISNPPYWQMAGHYWNASIDWLEILVQLVTNRLDETTDIPSRHQLVPYIERKWPFPVRWTAPSDEMLKYYTHQHIIVPAEWMDQVEILKWIQYGNNSKYNNIHQGGVWYLLQPWPQNTFNEVNPDIQVTEIIFSNIHDAFMYDKPIPSPSIPFWKVSTIDKDIKRHVLYQQQWLQSSSALQSSSSISAALKKKKSDLIFRPSLSMKTIRAANEPALRQAVTSPFIVTQLEPYQLAICKWLQEHSTKTLWCQLGWASYHDRNEPFYYYYSPYHPKALKIQQDSKQNDDLSTSIMDTQEFGVYGGILAAGTGMGKTLMMINHCELQRSQLESWKQSTNTTMMIKGCNLVICPELLVAHWKKELRKHIRKEYPRNIVTIDTLSELRSLLKQYKQQANLDIDYVVMSIKALSHINETMKQDLCNICWFSKIIDEAHEIEATCKMAQHLVDLPCRQCWMVTATPECNLSYMASMLRAPPLKKVEQGLIDNAMIHAEKHLLTKLPSARHEFIPVELNSETKMVMQQIVDRMCNQLSQSSLRWSSSSYTRSNNVYSDHTRKALERFHSMLLHDRLQPQQILDLMDLDQDLIDRARQRLTSSSHASNSNSNRLGQNVGLTTFDSLTTASTAAKQSQEEDCIICMETLSNALQTNCNHVFHRECLVVWMEKQQCHGNGRSTCPICRSTLQQLYLPMYAPTSSVTNNNNDTDVVMSENDQKQQGTTSSGFQGSSTQPNALIHAKCNKLTELLGRIMSESTDNKVIVFANDRSHLNVYGEVIASLNIPFVVLGTVKSTRAEKQDVIQQFESQPQIRILLAWSRDGSSGHDLICANYCINMDVGKFSVLKQQQGRVHRIGQTKPVTIYTLGYEGTTEEFLYSHRNDKQNWKWSQGHADECLYWLQDKWLQTQEEEIHVF